MSVFKAYDIRGVYPDEIDEHLFYRVGRASVAFLQCNEMVVGRDMRVSSPSLARAFCDGVIDQGCSVIDIGQVSTPLLYFAGRSHPACAMVTASHNPKEYNGLKICRGDSLLPVDATSGLLRIQAFVEEERFSSPRHKGLVTHKNFVQAYVKFSLSFLKAKRPASVVVDAGNGMGGITFRELMKEDVPFTLHPLYFTPDGSFPHHVPNPALPDTLTELAQHVVERRASFGVGLDGDADRCGFVDETGKVVPPSVLFALIAHELLLEQPGGCIVADLRMSRVVQDVVRRSGGRLVLAKAGRTNLKRALLEQRGIFGGELSGHFFFPETAYCENPIIMLCRVLNMLERTGKPLSALVRPLSEMYANSGEINLAIADKIGALAAVKDAFADGDVSLLDGVKVDFPSWWFSLRASNTEPLMRLVVEAQTESELAVKKAQVLKVLQPFLVREGSQASADFPHGLPPQL
ncbi:phosphomannomutase/phosphoglucomutase [Candidatus Woesearchaeota archaeon]|nr:MAG: phosphomannomutase/phosphoglucomutase [Candidatus Woesearchaeota archaeon]